MRIFVIFLFSVQVYGQVTLNPDAEPAQVVTEGFKTQSGVTKNAQDVVDQARVVFDNAYNKSIEAFSECQMTGKETSCLLAGIMSNYALNYAATLGKMEEFRRGVTVNDKTVTFTEESTKLTAIMSNIDWLKSQGYYFYPDGRIRLPPDNVTGATRQLTLNDLANETSLVATGLLTTAQITELKNAVQALGATNVDPIQDITPTQRYEVVESDTIPSSDTPDSPPLDDRSIASLNVTYLGEPIGVRLADIFNMVNIVYEELVESGDTL